MRKVSILLILIALFGVTAVPSFAQDSHIVDMLVESSEEEVPQFTILLAAVRVANPTIAEILSSEDSLTLFAPTDEAFNAFLEARGITLEELLADTETLNAVLQYHVLEGAVMSDDIALALEGSTALYAQTLLDDRLMVSRDGENIKINEATLIQADMEASNGIIHEIDRVLMPPGNIAEIIAERAARSEGAEFTTLLAAVQAAGLSETLADEAATFTLFAPTDAAFVAALEALGVTAEDLLANTENLTGILRHHVVADELYSGDIIAGVGEADEEGFSVDTLVEGDPITLTVTDAGVFVNGAPVTVTDIVASNGVIHVINAVILPNGE